MENLIYPTGLVISHNGPEVSVSEGNYRPFIAQIHYEPSDHHLKASVEVINGMAITDMPWSHRIVFMGPPIESVSWTWNPNAHDATDATRYFYPYVNILSNVSNGGAGITKVAWNDVADMFTGKNECLEVEFRLVMPHPNTTTVGYLEIDCKMPDWVFPH